MGLICNILIGVVHLVCVVMDIVFLMIAAKIIYDRWHPVWLRQIVMAIEPLRTSALNYVRVFMLKHTGRAYSERTLLILIVVCLMVMRMIITSVL